MTVSQILVLALMADAAWVAYGLYRKKTMWVFVVAYWCLLTLKNLADFMHW